MAGIELFVTRDEFETGMEEQVQNIVDVMNAFNEMKKVINTQAEVLSLHRYILETFVPPPLLEKATKEYKELREAQIAQETSGEKATIN